jgi:hypothetical protein
MLDLEGDRDVAVVMEWTLRGRAGGEDIFGGAHVGLATRPVCLLAPIKGPAVLPTLDVLPTILALEGPGTLSSFGRFAFESDCSSSTSGMINCNSIDCREVRCLPAFSFPSLASLDLNSAR